MLQIYVVSALLARIEELELENKHLSITPSFNVLTRAAVERKWLSTNKQNKCFIFFDIDNLHSLNAEYGYEEINSRIRLGLATLRSSELLGLVFSGDEFVAVVDKAEVNFMINRLQSEMANQGITVTCGVCELVSDDFDEHYEITKTLVTQAKKANKRNTVLWVDPH